MIERIIHALRTVPRTLLPLISLPIVAAAALSLWLLVNLAEHGAGGSSRAPVSRQGARIAFETAPPPQGAKSPRNTSQPHKEIQ